MLPSIDNVFKDDAAATTTSPQNNCKNPWMKRRDVVSFATSRHHASATTNRLRLPPPASHVVGFNNAQRQRPPAFFATCDPCNRFFRTKDEHDQHRSEHMVCPHKSCGFEAHIKVVIKHFELQHVSGLYERIGKLETEQDIAQWREERKSNFPTAERQRRIARERIERRLRARGHWASGKSSVKVAAHRASEKSSVTAVSGASEELEEGEIVDGDDVATTSAVVVGGALSSIAQSYQSDSETEALEQSSVAEIYLKTGSGVVTVVGTESGKESTQSSMPSNVAGGRENLEEGEILVPSTTTLPAPPQQLATRKPFPSKNQSAMRRKRPPMPPQRRPRKLSLLEKLMETDRRREQQAEAEAALAMH